MNDGVTLGQRYAQWASINLTLGQCMVFAVSCLSVEMIDVRVWGCRPLGYERVYLQLYKVADTPFHI